MAKKKKSRASAKKNRKGAAGKANTASTNSERVHSKQDSSMSGNNADLRPFQIDESLPLFSQALFQNANHHIQNQSLGSKEQERLLKKMGAIYNKDLRKWVMTLYMMMGTGELFSLGSSMSVIFDKLVFLMMNTISAIKKKDVLIDGLHLHMVVNLMCSLMHVMNCDENKVLDLLESLTNTAKAVNGTHYSSSGAAYVLCHSMIHCYFHIREKKRDDAKPLMMIARSGILEQVLLHIHLSWSPLVDEQALVDEYNGPLYKFFGFLNSYTAVLHKIFKEGTGCHNALDAIVQDHIRPCRKNMHMMELLQSIKKISELSNFSNEKNSDLSICKPVDKQHDTDETVIDMARHTCAKCKTVDLERPLLVCAKCEGVSYCSKECQVTDWKNHKVECCKKSTDTTASKKDDIPVINLTRRICAKCDKVYPDKQLLVCAKCKYVGYCSKECQVSDWKNHKVECDFYRKTKYKNIDEITQNFCVEHRNLITEKVKAATVETGLDSMDLALDLDFMSASGEVPPALRDPPEFEVLPASVFWNREKDKAPANHWYFKDLGRGKTYYSDADVNRIRQSVSAKNGTLGLNLVFVFLNFGETPSISAIPSSIGSVQSMGSLRRSAFIDNVMNGMNETTNKIPASKRVQFEKDTRELVEKTFDALFGAQIEK